MEAAGDGALEEGGYEADEAEEASVVERGVGEEVVG